MSVGLSDRQAMSTWPVSTAVFSAAGSLRYWTKICLVSGVLGPS